MDRFTEETLCNVQAQLYTQRIALRALARTHPDPAGLLAAWREAQIESATCCPVAPAGSRHSDYLTEQMRVWAEDWTAELVELAVATPERSMIEAIAGTPPLPSHDGHTPGHRMTGEAD